MLNQLLARKTDFSNDDHAHGPALRRTLGPWGITALGIGAVIGTGIFVVTGTAAAEHAGPAVLISFIIAAIVSGFSALCYAEYGISASAVAASWTGYFTSLLDHMGIHLPRALTEAPLAYTGGELVVTGHLFNLPAVAIVLALTWLCYLGIRESSTLNSLMVLVKVGLIVIVVVVGYRYVNPENWHPFIPEPQGNGKYGWSGIMRGAAMVFFAYIGFEATSTAAQECKNPQRDLPFGILVSLVICTVLYLAMAAVLTGLVPYTELDTPEPVVTAVAAHPELGWLRLIMARDGMLPKMFAKVHPRHRTPHINTLFTGGMIALLAAVFPLDLLANLTSMGTLIAFSAVCGGVLILRHTMPDLPRTFRVPWVWFTCLAGVASCFALLFSLDWFNWAILGGWTVLGFAIYFLYSRRHSVLRQSSQDVAITKFR